MKVKIKTTNRIDVHHHIIPDVYREGLAAYGIYHAGGMPIKKWRIEDSFQWMEDFGIQTAICSLTEPAVYPLVDKSLEDAKTIARKTNEYMAEMHQKYPERFGGFAVVPMPDIEASVEEMEYALDVLKLDGIGLLSNYYDNYLGDSIYDDFFQELQKRKAVVYVHPSIPNPAAVRPEFLRGVDFMQEFTFNTHRAQANLIFSGTMERCPDVKLIFSHMGGTFPYLRYRLYDLFAGAVTDQPLEPRNPRNLPLAPHVIEAWYSLKKPLYDYMELYWYDTALSCHEIAFEAIKITAPGHTLFGSDSFYAFWENAKRNVEITEKYFDDAELYAVNRGNAERLFPQYKQ
jgi:predicted TIM-barrel fold metal-dependent hydrolase